jgi:Tol biopolymer transport system component
VAVFAACSDPTGGNNQPALVFEWLRTDNRDIYRAAMGGLDTLRLTTDPGEDVDPTSGGGMVVFTSYRDGNGELYSVNATGGAARRLTNTTTNETQAALSRDGAHLAFISDVSGVPKLWVSAGDGSGAAPVTAGFAFPGSPEAGPSWSPGGDRIAFVSAVNGSADIFLVTPGSAPVALVTDPAADVEPAWSPPGSEIAFVSDRDGDAELYIVSIQTGQVRRITNRPDTDAQPAWLPDGKLIFTAWVNGIPRLRWLDPAAPGQVTDVPVGAPDPAQHPAAIF